MLGRFVQTGCHSTAARSMVKDTKQWLTACVLNTSDLAIRISLKIGAFLDWEDYALSQPGRKKEEARLTARARNFTPWIMFNRMYQGSLSCLCVNVTPHLEARLIECTRVVCRVCERARFCVHFLFLFSFMAFAVPRPIIGSLFSH